MFVSRASFALCFALTVLVASAHPAAAGVPVDVCCVCDCAPQPSACLATSSASSCDTFLSECGSGLNATCQTNVLNGSCAGVAACGGETAPAPAVGVTGLTAFVLLLAGYGALRLRRATRRG